jgi:hypothetical protein
LADQSLKFRAIAGGFALADRVLPSRLRPGHEPEALLRVANAVPSAGARLGLAALAESIAAESQLTMFGQVSVRWDFLRLLNNAGRIEAAHEANPVLGSREVTAPIFILGLPRSGTTFLHALLAEDAGNLVPRNWQTIYPAPRPPDFAPARDKAARRVDAQLRFFAGIAPEFPAAHPIVADSPQECSEITAHVFQSLRFDTTFRVPSYRAWLDERGHDEAFAFHKRFLQVLQGGLAAENWVLKCPDHIFSMPSILRTYPDARFVIVHRDPIKVFGSVAHLTEILRRPFVKNVDPAEIGVQVTERWIDGAQRLVAFDQDPAILAGRKVHLHHDDLVADPIASVARIYAHFGMDFSPAAQMTMSQALRAKPRGGYSGQRRYALGRFGIDPDWLGAQFTQYRDYFGVAAQAAE